MNRRTIYAITAVVIISILVGILSTSEEKNKDSSERFKISIRDIGNQLLLSIQDSTSLILPVVELENSKYELSFQNKLSILPDSLVTIVEKSLERAGIGNDYLVEVIQCEDQEVAYSYEIKNEKGNSIIPCKGRGLPEQCYTVEVKFTNRTSLFLTRRELTYMLVLIILVMLLEYLFHKRKQGPSKEGISTTYAAIGSFQFYPEQNKLVKSAVEISLSKKECELLTIFVANSNQIIKRDELMKKVWEDNGVIVGRSLDTYISKLRKKLQDDQSIKLTNIHGVGYKLEVAI